MTKKLLFGLLLTSMAFTATQAQTQVIEQAAQLLSSTGQGGATAVAAGNVTQQDAEAVEMCQAKIAQSRQAGQSKTPAATIGESVKAERAKSLGQPAGKYTAGSWQVANNGAARRAAKAPTAVPDVLNAAEYDTKYSDGTTTVNGVVTIKKTDDTHAVLYNLWGLTDTLQCTYNLTAGTVAVTPAKIYDHSTYGPVWACSMDLDKRVYSTSTPITGTIGADGTITLGAWGVIVTTGESKGGSFAIFSKSEFKPTNATISETIYNGKSATNTDSVRTYPVYIDQTYDNQVDIVNFTNNGAVVKMRLNTDKSVSISPQRIFTNAFYGPFNCYPANWAKSKSAQKGNIVGTGTDTEINFGNYGVFCQASLSTRALGVLSATIKFNSGVVKYPTKSVQDWKGDGTEASPFIISTPSQLNAFADDVNSGNDYKGKYVKLGNDIDLSSSTLAYTPVGTEDAPFRGSFNGGGNTVKNLYINVGAEDYQGLFGVADSTSSISNLKMQDATIVTAGTYAGTVAGKCSGTMTDITVDGGKITATGYGAAGVVGYFNGPELTNCQFDGSITGAGENGGVAGTIAGQAVASKLAAHGLITVTSLASSTWKSLGGVVGSLLPGKQYNALLTDSYSDMQLTDKSGNAYVGGVAGEVLDATLQRSFNAGSISAASTTSGSSTKGAVGGVAGEVYGGNVYDCYNGNLVLNSGNSTSVGGVIGYIPSPSCTTDSHGNREYSYLSSVKRCFNYGQVRNGAVYEKMGVYGTAYSDSVFADVYHDQQMVGTIMPASAKHMEQTTAQLTSGKAYSGFDASVWTFTNGLYPRLKAMESTNAAYLSAAPISFKNGENVTKVRSTFKVSTANDIYWKLYNGSTFADESSGLKIAGDSVTVKSTYANEVLVALSKADNSIVKMYSIATVNPTLFSGSGTEADPYLIKSKADLEAMDEGISKYGQTFKGDFFKQTNDIDASGFGGIGMGGNIARQFNATYDGGGHAIHNLKIDGVVYGADGKADKKQSLIAVSLFGFIGTNGTVKNLAMASDCSFKAYDYASGIAAVNYGRVINCKNYADVATSYNYAGGVVALNQPDAVVDGCYNAGHIITGNAYAAGIAAYSLGTVQYCQNDGYIEGDSVDASHKANSQYQVAGIVATNGSESLIRGNINSGSIYANRTVGGITTTAVQKGNIEYNINYGTVERSKAGDAARGAVLATAPSVSYAVANNYYDAQIGYYGAAASASIGGATGVNTSVLTSGKAIEGFDSDRYDWSEGLYPVIKAFKDEPAAIANRKMVVTFANGQSADDVYTDAKLYKASDLQWTLESGKNFSAANGVLKVNLTADTTSLRDVLTAKVGNYSKVIALRAMPNVFEGQGTADDPFQIKSKDDMLKLAKFTNTEAYPFSGRYFKVLNDIDFGSTTYESVGVDAGSFNGDFNGNGKKFLNINNTYTSTQSSRGLFGNVGPQGSVHDLIVASGTITSYRYNGAVAGNVYGKVYNCQNYANIYSESSAAAGIAGYVKNGGSVVNCQNHGKVDSKGNYLAGIAYYVEKGALVDNCENDTVVGAEKKNGVGGIATYSYGTIRNCVNKGTLVGLSNIGGILANSYGGDSILYCHNEGEIQSTGSSVGGILGTGKKSLAPVVITGCHNTAAVTGKGYIGGVAGRLYSGSVLTDCYNTGDVTSISSSNIGGVAGALAGDNGYVSSMTRCYNTGNIISAGQYTGGVVGDNDEETYYEDCYNTGDIICSAKYAAGFAGSMSGKAVNCYNTGNVEASGYGIGGFGGIGAGEIHNCFNLGNVTSTSAANSYGVAGGLWGYGRCKIYNSYNMGKVSGQGYVGGIAGGTFDGFTLVNSYNAGEISTPDTTHSGNICPLNNDKELYFTNVYYDTDVNKGFTPSNTDALAKGVSTRDLTLCNALEGDTVFTLIPGMYPTIKAQAQNELANWWAAVPVVGEGEDYQHVRSAFTVGSPAGTVWTTSEHLFLKDDKVNSNENGAAWVTKTYGDHVKTYNLVIERATGVDGIGTDAAIVKTDYYTVGGVALGSQRPDAAGIYIAKDFYTNGKSAAHKIVVSGK